MMNTTQKEKVRQMRCSGLGYAKIASALGLSENTIKSFCQRYRLTRSEEAFTESNQIIPAYCLSCGLAITQTLGYRGRKYCSDKCRISWWNNHRTAPDRKNTRLFTCHSCEKQFYSYGKRERKYCSRNCCAKAKVVSR